MVKDCSWMLMETADRTTPDHSNPKVIIINQPQEDDRVSQQDRALGNPFTGPGHVMANLHDCSNVPPPNQPGNGDEDSGKGHGFCDLV